jgi:VanZ family protein
MVRHKSSAVPLAWLYVGLIVYASLYPFEGWRWPALSPFAFLTLPWPRYWTAFDLLANLLGYLPLGLLLFAAQIRLDRSALGAFAIAVLMSAGLSFSLELTQNALPSRVASNVDIAINTAGAFVGAVTGLLLHAAGLLERWHRWRERWFVDRSAGAVALLLLWPAGLLFPTPLPLGMGRVLSRLRETLVELLADTPAADWALDAFEDHAFSQGLPPAGEVLAVALGLLAPCLLALSVCQSGWRRGVMVLVIGAIGVATTTLSTALNFSPQHAMAWLTPTASVGLGLGCLVALLLTWLPRRAAAALGLMALTALVCLVAQTPADAYFAESLQAWEQGRFIRFNGAAQWVGWLWPYAAMTYLLSRVAARDDHR